MHISSDHRIEPDGAIIPHDDVANQGSVIRKPTVLSHFGRFIFYSFDQCHIYLPFFQKVISQSVFKVKINDPN